MEQLGNVFEKVEVLIITALQEELKALLDHFPPTEKHHSDFSNHTYYLGSLNTPEGVFSFGCMRLRQMGNTDAAVDTVAAIRDLRPSYVFMFGIAAGIKGRARFADVIIPEYIYYYEQAKLDGRNPEIRPQVQRSSAFLNDRLKAFALSYDEQSNYDIKFGPFASGEKVVASNAFIEKLIEAEPKLLGVEMESFGVARAVDSAIDAPHY